MAASSSHPESDLRQTAIDEYFASCHKSRCHRRRGNKATGSCFRPGLPTRFKWWPDWQDRARRASCIPVFASPLRRPWPSLLPPGASNIDPGCLYPSGQAPSFRAKIPDSGLRCAVHAKGGAFP